MLQVVLLRLRLLRGCRLLRPLRLLLGECWLSDGLWLRCRMRMLVAVWHGCRLHCIRRASQPTPRAAVRGAEAALAHGPAGSGGAALGEMLPGVATGTSVPMCAAEGQHGAQRREGL